MAHPPFRPSRVLTPAEARVVAYLVAAFERDDVPACKEIGDALGIACETVYAHLTSIAQTLPGPAMRRDRVGLYVARLCTEREIARRAGMDPNRSVA